MTILIINGKEVLFDEKREYLSIGEIGSTHGGAVYGEDEIHLEKLKRRISQLPLDSFENRTKDELSMIRDLLRNGKYDGTTSVIELTPEKEEPYKNTVELYERILSAISEEAK